MAKICVVHLVRECNGVEAFRSFVDSYQLHDSGIKHKFLIVFKGFFRNSVEKEYLDLLKDIPFQSLFLPDKGFDIGPYFASAHNGDEDYFCFLNSFSCILEAGWLEFLYRQLDQPKVGVVGATGSWESHYDAYRESLKSLEEVEKQSGFSLRQWIGHPMRPFFARKMARDFLTFPNYHLRTNAFIISRQLFLSIRSKKIRSKSDALKFESGRYSLTQQLLARDLQPVVVGRDGCAYGKEEWFQSHTFRSGNQENLLISDNQTRRYQYADAKEQKMLSEFSWGKN